MREREGERNIYGAGGRVKRLVEGDKCDREQHYGEEAKNEK